MSSQDQPPRLSRNAVAILTAFVFAALVSFFLSPFIVKQLGATGYGVWSLLAGLVGYLGLLDFGIQQAVNRYVAHHHAVAEHEESSLIVSAALKLFTSLSLAAVLLSVVLAYLAPMLFHIPEAFLYEARVVLVLGGFTIATSLARGVFTGVVSGLQRFDVDSILEIAVTTIRATATVLVLLAGYGIVGLAAVHLSASVLQLLGSQAAARHLYREMRLQLLTPMRRQTRSLLSFGAASVAVTALSALIFRSDTVLIAIFLPIEAVTFYAIATNLAWQASHAVSAVSWLLLPRVSALASLGSTSQIGAQVLMLGKAMTLMVGPIVATFILRGESFIDLWMGSEYGSTSGEILAVLAVVVWSGALRTVAIQSLVGLGKHRTLIPGFMGEAVANVALSVALVQSLGIFGVALGTLFPNLVMNLGYLPRTLAKAAGLSRWHLYRDAILLPTVSCVPFALGSAVVEQFVPATSLAVFFLQVFVLLPLVPAVAWFTCLSPIQRERMRAGLAS